MRVIGSRATKYQLLLAASCMSAGSLLTCTYADTDRLTACCIRCDSQKSRSLISLDEGGDLHQVWIHIHHVGVVLHYLQPQAGHSVWPPLSLCIWQPMLLCIWLPTLLCTRQPILLCTWQLKTDQEPGHQPGGKGARALRTAPQHRGCTFTTAKGRTVARYPLEQASTADAQEQAHLHHGCFVSCAISIGIAGGASQD